MQLIHGDVFSSQVRRDNLPSWTSKLGWPWTITEATIPPESSAPNNSAPGGGAATIPPGLPYPTGHAFARVTEQQEQSEVEGVICRLRACRSIACPAAKHRQHTSEMHVRIRSQGRDRSVRTGGLSVTRTQPESEHGQECADAVTATSKACMYRGMF